MDSCPDPQGARNMESLLYISNHATRLLSSFQFCHGYDGFSSVANYAAANTFLDSFVTYRHSQKLPASVIDLGVMGDIGYAAEKNPQALKVFNTLDSQILEERHLLQAVEISIFSQFSHP
jgi:hypothetical protein